VSYPRDVRHRETLWGDVVKRGMGREDFQVDPVCCVVDCDRPISRVVGGAGSIRNTRGRVVGRV
jgi:hypothetical protein